MMENSTPEEWRNPRVTRGELRWPDPAEMVPVAPAVLHDLAERLFLVEDQPAWSPRLRSASKIERPPSGLCVVIPVGVAHMRPDGVSVVPLTVLGP